MFRSGILTQRRVEQIVKRAEATPHNLRIVAKACSILPQDLLAWFAAGQDPACTNPQMAELAWRINGLRADCAARNYARIEAAANGGKKRKEVTEADGSVQRTEEDVLPQAWAIEQIEKLAAASHWEIAPDAEQADELHRMMRELAPTPLLTSGPEARVAAGVEDSLLDDPPGAAPFPGAEGLRPQEGQGEVPAGAVGGDVGGGDDVVHTQTLTEPE